MKIVAIHCIFSVTHAHIKCTKHKLTVAATAVGKQKQRFFNIFAVTTFAVVTYKLYTHNNNQQPTTHNNNRHSRAVHLYMWSLFELNEYKYGGIFSFKLTFVCALLEAFYKNQLTNLRKKTHTQKHTYRYEFICRHLVVTGDDV